MLAVSHNLCVLAECHPHLYKFKNIWPSTTLVISLLWPCIFDLAGRGNLSDSVCRLEKHVWIKRPVIFVYVWYKTLKITKVRVRICPFSKIFIYIITKAGFLPFYLERSREDDMVVWCSVRKRITECRISQLLAKSKCVYIFSLTTYVTDAFLNVSTV